MRLDGASPQFEDLADDLVARGLAVTDHPLRGSNARLVDFRHPDGLMVRMVRDEGRWSMVIGWVAWKDFFEADYWESCLSGREMPRVASPPEAQAAWVRARLSELLEIGEDGPLECMRLARRREAVKSMGLF